MSDEEFTFRGKTMEELKQMNLNQFSELLNARGRRKINRGLRETEKKMLQDLENKDTVKTHERDMIVVPAMVGKTIKIYNGQKFESIEVDEEMLGHYLGEFSKTRKRVSHSAPGLGATRSSQHVPLK
jgi:small subunit ribosomal protein S19